MRSLGFILGLFLLAGLPVQAMDLSFLKADKWDHMTAQAQLRLANDPNYVHLLWILPDKYKLISSHESAELQDLIDEAYLKIVNTPTGRNSCTEVAGGSREKIKSLFGVSSAAAQQMLEQCQNSTHKQPVKREFNKEFIFILTPESNLPLHSWTSPRNKTYVLLRPDEINVDHILRVLIHEMAVKFDMKEQWGTWGTLTGHKFFQVHYLGGRDQDVLSVIREPKVKYLFSAIRAFQIEKQIMQELGFSVADDFNWLEASCEERVLSIWDEMQGLSKLYQADELITALMLPIKKKSQSEIIKILSEEVVQAFDNDPKQTVCDYLSTPQLGSWSFSAYEGGPRPRVGNGKIENIKNLIKEKNLQDKLRKIEIKTNTNLPITLPEHINDTKK